MEGSFRAGEPRATGSKFSRFIPVTGYAEGSLRHVSEIVNKGGTALMTPFADEESAEGFSFCRKEIT